MVAEVGGDAEEEGVVGTEGFLVMGATQMIPPHLNPTAPKPTEVVPREEP